MQQQLSHGKLSTVNEQTKLRRCKLKCPSCGKAKLVREKRDLAYIYKGKTTIIPTVKGDFCLSCDEGFIDREDTARVSSTMVKFHKQINAAIVDPSSIARVRKKLRLDQRQASNLFGGGVNAFSRYETGKTKPPLSLVQLFRVLERHPELLVEIENYILSQ